MEKPETRKLRRTVIIGLGGTGKKALLHTKKRFLETFGEEPPLVKFLLIDTTSANTDSLTVRPFNSSDPQEVRLKASEVLHIEARGASLLPKVHDEIRDWFPTKVDLKANILSGAGQIRALGRLALYANATLVYENLRDLLALARDYRYERPNGNLHYIYEAYSPHLTVALVGSLAGGTGSGIFLDVAMVLRELMKDEDQLFGYFLLPDIYVNRPGTQNVEANAYAALLELDHLMSREDTWTYSFGGRKINVRKKPFDMVFLVNRENRAGKTVNEIDDLTDLLGFGLYLLAGPLGKEQADVFDNIVHQLNEQKGKYYGKTAHYASFGAAEVRFNPDAVEREELQHRRRETARSWITKRKIWRERFWPEPSDLTEGVQPENDLRHLANRSVKEALPEIEAAVETLPAEIRDKTVSKWKKELPEKVNLDLHLENAFSQDYSLEDLLEGLQWAKDEIQKLADQARKEADDVKKSLDEKVDGLRAQIRTRPAPRFFLLRQSGQQESGVRRQDLNAIMGDIKNRGLKMAQQTLYDDLLKQCALMQNKLQEAIKELKNLLNGEEIPSGSAETTHDPSPFVLTLPPPYLAAKGAPASYSVNDTQARIPLKEVLEHPREALKRSVEQIDQSLRDWLKSVISLRERGQLTLWEAVERTFRELDEVSAPSWDYLDAWVSNPGLSYREHVHIMGIEHAHDNSHPLVEDERLLSVFAGTLHDRMRLQRVSTGDPFRVLFYKVEASIPAFVLRGVDIYKSKYETLSKDRSFHIDRRWEHGLPDLFPLPSEKEAAQVWTKARFLGLLYLEDHRYFFNDRRQGTEKRRELGSSPSEAFSHLARDFFAFKELEAQVKEVEYQRLGEIEALRNAVEAALRNREELLNSDNWSEDDKAVFRLERQVLEEWQKELANYNPHTKEDRFPSFPSQ